MKSLGMATVTRRTFSQFVVRHLAEEILPAHSDCIIYAVTLFQVVRFVVWMAEGDSQWGRQLDSQNVEVYTWQQLQHLEDKAEGKHCPFNM